MQQPWSLYTRNIGICLSRWLVLAWFLWLLLTVCDATAAHSAPIYRCSGHFRPTSAIQVTCDKPWKQCNTGSMVIHPDCLSACDAKHIAACVSLRQQQQIRCREGLTKQSCVQEAQQWKVKCVDLSKQAQAACQSKADSKACVFAFQEVRKKCQALQGQGEIRCRRSYRQRMEICRRLLIKFRQQRRQICTPLFDSCIERCDRENWPCRKQCFAQRYRCVNQESVQDKLCRNIGVQLSGECSLKVNQQFRVCLRKGQDVLERCVESLQRKYTVCEIDVGQTYTHCIEDTEKIKLHCWFRQMDWKDLCSGLAYRRCYGPLRISHETCLRSCPRCIYSPIAIQFAPRP